MLLSANVLNEDPIRQLANKSAQPSPAWAHWPASNKFRLRPVTKIQLSLKLLSVYKIFKPLFLVCWWKFSVPKVNLPSWREKRGMKSCIDEYYYLLFQEALKRNLIFDIHKTAPCSGLGTAAYRVDGQFGHPHENFAQSVSIFWRTFLNSSFWRISVTQLGTARCPDPGLMVSPSFTSFSFSLSVSLSPFTCWHGRGLSTGPLLLQWHKSSVSQW